MTDDDRRIIPACEDFATIAAKLREIEEAKQRELERAEADYSGYGEG